MPCNPLARRCRRLRAAHALFLLALLLVALSQLSSLRHLAPHPAARTRASALRFAAAPVWRDVDAHGNPLALPLTPRRARNRVFLSAIGNDSSDGLGHRFLMINFELNMAHDLSLAYVHRAARYDSLTSDADPRAVDRLFGWAAYPHTRADVLSASCHVVYNYSTCDMGPYRAPACNRLRARAHAFKHLVTLDARLFDCYVDASSPNRTHCESALSATARRHALPDTLFQMSASRCGSDYRLAVYTHTGRWLRRQYWRAHRHTTALRPVLREQAADPRNHQWLQELQRATRVRALPFVRGRLQVAVHVRRGDLFFYKPRDVVPDLHFARAVAAVARAAARVFGGEVGLDVSVFAEGVIKPGVTNVAHHDVRHMVPVYMSDPLHYRPNATRFWTRLIADALAEKGNHAHVRTYAFIATDTIAAVHAMVCADVFVGSVSGLSMQVVATLARGVRLMSDIQKFRRRDNVRDMALLYHGEREEAVNASNLDKCLIRLFPTKRLE